MDGELKQVKTGRPGYAQSSRIVLRITEAEFNSVLGWYGMGQFRVNADEKYRWQFLESGLEAERNRRIVKMVMIDGCKVDHVASSLHVGKSLVRKVVNDFADACRGHDLYSNTKQFSYRSVRFGRDCRHPEKGYGLKWSWRYDSVNDQIEWLVDGYAHGQRVRREGIADDPSIREHPAMRLVAARMLRQAKKRCWQSIRQYEKEMERESS